MCTGSLVASVAFAALMLVIGVAAEAGNTTDMKSIAQDVLGRCDGELHITVLLIKSPVTTTDCIQRVEGAMKVDIHLALSVYD